MTSRFPPFAFVELVSPYNKKNITRWLEGMNFMFSWQEHKIHIFSPPCNILYILHHSSFVNNNYSKICGDGMSKRTMSSNFCPFKIWLDANFCINFISFLMSFWQWRAVQNNIVFRDQGKNVKKRYRIAVHFDGLA